jgi:hypothetical protein
LGAYHDQHFGGIVGHGKSFFGHPVKLLPLIVLNLIIYGLCLIALHNGKKSNLRFTKEAFPDIRFRGELRPSQQIISIYI